MALDFVEIKGRHRLSDIVGARVKLKRVGNEYVGLCPFHVEKTPSFTCVDDRNFAYCFGCGWSGDVTDFIAKYHELSLVDAYEYLGGPLTPLMSKVKPRAVKAGPILLPSAEVPADHEPFEAGQRIRAWNPKAEDWVTYRPDAIWAYRSRDDVLMGYIARIDRADGGKIIIPLRPVIKGGETVWSVSHFQPPRPLYGLQKLVDDGQVFLCEGEKSADAAALLVNGIAMAWPGGVNGVAHTDFTPLAGRRVVVWGDADAPGEDAAKRVGVACLKAGAAQVKIIAWDQDKPEGWDAADAFEDMWTPQETMDWLRSRAYLFKPTQEEIEAANIIPPEPPPAALAAAASGDFDAQAFTGELPPPRPWAYGRMLLYRTVTALVAPAGTGKSTWALQLAMQFCLHRPLGPFEPIKTGPAWVWNNEDDTDELNRRILAACDALQVDPGSLAGRLYLNSGADRKFIVAQELPRIGFVASPDVARVIEIIRERGIKLLIVDPFAETFEVESENSNDIMKRVAALYRDIAQATQCAVLIVVHPPKGKTGDNAAGDPDSIRGAGAVIGVVRSAWTMFEMTEKDAETVGVPEDSRHLYIRIDPAKANMALKSGGPSWWRRETVFLGNGNDDYPEDAVGVLMPQQFTSVQARSAQTNEDYIERLSAEIVRVCERNGWTSRAKSAPLDTLVNALDVIKTGVKSTKSKGLIIGQMAPLHGFEEWVIIVSEHHVGTMTKRRIHIEERK